LELLGIDLEAVLMPIAAMYAGEADMSPRERDLSRRAREAERRERMSRLTAKAEKQKLEQGRKSQAVTRLQEHIAGFRTIAFTQVKIPDSPTARRIFEDHLRSHWTTGDLNAKIANDAAKATYQDLVAMAQALGTQAPAMPPDAALGAALPSAQLPVAPRRPPPPRGAAPGGGSAAPQQAGSVSDFRSAMEARRDRRR
jgi:hypothetical protein